MEFYRILSRAYDDIFPFSDVTYGFLKERAKSPVLDIGCATGAYVKAFQKDGMDAVGIEYVPELIKHTEGVSVGDMRELPASFGNSFGFAYCIGNTLVHCTDLLDCTNILKGFNRVLKEDGVLVIQILNYDRILKKRPSELPSIKTDKFFFRREYFYQNSNIEFKGTLSSDGYEAFSSVYLFPLKSDELKSAAENSGFKSVKLYQDFSGAEFDIDNSFALVAVLQK